MVPKLKEPFPTRKSAPLTKVINPFQKFLKYEASSGLLLLVVVIFTLIWANSWFSNDYFKLWTQSVGITFGSFKLEKALLLWINDLLMAVFFLLVGLEIKREFMIGELKSIRKALLPLMAALGGIIIPASIFVLINFTTESNLQGWAVPVATDIAFALGILYLLGDRVPPSLKVFLATLAIIDDISAIIIIAIFYTETVYFNYLMLAGFIFLVLIFMNKLHIRSISLYVTIGSILWYALLKSGIHATLAGILLAFTIPATMKINYKEFKIQINGLVDNLNTLNTDNNVTSDDLSVYLNSVLTLEKVCEDVEAPLLRLEKELATYVAFIIMPVFAFANAGVEITGSAFGELSSPLVLGIVIGLVIGKPLGIFLFSWVAVKFNLASLPTNASWRHLIGTGFLAGIGFTMSIFIGSLAFLEESTLQIVKFAILIASTISGIIGFSILRMKSSANV